MGAIAGEPRLSVVIDPGHGGADTGATVRVGRTFLSEKEDTLALAKQTAAELMRRAYAEAGITKPREQVSLVDVHDCFSVTELVTMEDLQLSAEGTAIRDVLGRGEDLVLEIDWQGAQQVRKLHPGCVGVFILPPSVAELERRMRTRGQDSDAVIRRRLTSAEEEISHAPEFDYVIINNNFEEARRDLAAVVRAARLTLARQSARHPELFQLHG